MSDFFEPEILDEDSENTAATYALMAIFSYSYDLHGESKTLELMGLSAKSILKNRDPESKKQNLFDYLITLKDIDQSSYLSTINSFSGFANLKEGIKSKINQSLIGSRSLEDSAIILTSLIFGYSLIYDTVEDLDPYLEKNQKELFSGKLPLSRASLESDYDNDSYVDLKFSLSNSGEKQEVIFSILKYINVKRLFNQSPPIIPNSMKDSEIQSYNISGKVNYFYGFDPSIVDCEQIEVDGVIGFRTYPCNRVSVKPRDLQFNQTITDGPYSSGKNVLPVFANDPNSLADDGIKLLTSIKNSYYDSSRTEGVKILNQNAAVAPFFASYDSGWVFDEFMKEGSRLVNLRGDVDFANNADSFKSFPDGAETGQYHFLGSYTFITGTGVGQISEYSGFNPILLRLNDKDEQRIYSQLEVNLFDKQKRSGQLMAYAVSTDKDILSSFSDGDSYRYPLLSIANHTPSIPFIGINLEFSSKTFNKKPAAKFNFGSLYFVPPTAFNNGGSFTTATDFSFTGFDFTGDYFALSTGSIKFNKEIKNSQNFNPQEAFVNEPVPSPGEGLIPLQSGSRLLQKALGFSNYEDCIAGVEDVKTGYHYGVEYKSIPILDLDGNVILDIDGNVIVLKPPEIENEQNNHVKRIGDTGVLKYVTGFGAVGETSPLLSKRVFGPLESKTDQGLDGKDFNYKYLPEDYKTEELLYAHVPALNPARYYSGLFASERRQFLYPSAKKIHDNSGNAQVATGNRYFPSQVKLSFIVEEEYSKSQDGALSRYGTSVATSINNLNEVWVDQDFSHENLRRYFPGGHYDYWTYNPLISRALNPHSQHLTGGVLSISDGKFNQESSTSYYFDRIEEGDSVQLHLPNTPLKSNLKESYSFDIELNYNLPIKSLSDFLDHPEHSNKAFISTGDSEITIINVTGSYVTGWGEQINIDVNNGCDPLFGPYYGRIPLDNNKNISGDSWNGFYLRSGTVYYPHGYYPYRAAENDKILVEASDNSSNLRLLLRNLKIFPSFANNNYDLSYSGSSLASTNLSGERQRDNFKGDLRIFEINTDSLFDKIPKNEGSTSLEVSSFVKNIPLDLSIGKSILRTGKLYYAPELVDRSVMLPEVSEKQYKQITDLYPQLNGYTFRSGVDAYSRMNSGYYIKYTESSNLKLTITGVEVKYDRFPASDELFEFHLTGKANFSGELSYKTQEESSIITHGLYLREKTNPLDEFQKYGYFFDHCSPFLQSLAEIDTKTDTSGQFRSVYPFPTKQIRRRNRLISGNDSFVETSKSSPNNYNRFFVSALPEFVKFSNNGSVLGSPGLDHLLYQDTQIITSSSEDYEEEYENGEVKKVKRIDKEYEVKESVRTYDAFFTKALLNSGFFLQKSSNVKIEPLNSNLECKTFYAVEGTTISDLEAGEERNLSITMGQDRLNDFTKIRDSNKPTGKEIGLD